MTTRPPPSRPGERDDWAPPAYAPPEVLAAAPFEHGDDAYGSWLRFAVGDAAQRMRWIPPGSFAMGLSPQQSRDLGFDDAPPQRRVTLTRGFWIADTPCTEALWRAVMHEGPRTRRPASPWRWDKFRKFLTLLAIRVPGLEPRMPTEAEWEYACRAGTETPRYGDYHAIAWTADNCDDPQPVAGKLANAWGLYDTLGNYDELCSDRYGPLVPEPVTDPAGARAGAELVSRGGSYVDQYAWVVHAAARRKVDISKTYPGVSLRLARDALP